MSNRNVAMEFLRCFCAGDVNGVACLLATDLQFTGPFHRFRSRDAYLDCLKHDPPEKGGYRVLSITEGDESVSIYYEDEKNAGAITVAQLFTFRNHEISEVLVVFDGRGFA